MTLDIVQRATSLAAEVRALQRRCDRLESLCGQMVATLCVTANRDRMLAGDRTAVVSLLTIADGWGRELQNVVGPWGTPLKVAPSVPEDREGYKRLFGHYIDEEVRDAAGDK